MGEYQLLTGRISYPVNFLPSADALGTEITEAEEEENKRRKKMKYMWYETDEEREAFIAAWDYLRKQWQDDEGNTLRVDTVHEGDMPSYGSDPTKRRPRSTPTPSRVGILRSLRRLRTRPMRRSSAAPSISMRSPSLTTMTLFSWQRLSTTTALPWLT